jgi:glycosyltransferase involved in cell wall biosynthesis
VRTQLLARTSTRPPSTNTASTPSERPGIVMLLTNNPYPHDVRVSKEAVTLARAGYRVSVICPRRHGQPARERIDDVDIQRFRFPGFPHGFFGYLFEHAYGAAACLGLSLRILWRDGFDVVHVNNPPDTLGLVAAVHRLLGKRVMFEHRDIAPEMYRARFGDRSNHTVFRVLGLLEKLCCRLSDHVIAMNDSYKALEMGRGGVPPERITVVRYGADVDFWRSTPADASVRDGAAFVVGWIGVMGFQDGVDYLLRAMRHLVRDLGRTNVRCLIIGAGDALGDMRALATDLGLDRHVRFPGMLFGEQLVAHAAAADVLVVPDPSNPYTDRSTLVKIVEYMALGKPIVAFDLPEHRISAGPAAVYVRPNDEMAFAHAIADLMDAPERRRRLGELGRRRVEERYSWDHSAAHLLAAYDTILRA